MKKETIEGMKETIEKIEVNEVVVQQRLEWLSEGHNHALEFDGLSDLVRYLLIRVNELESRLDHFKTQTHDPPSLQTAFNF